jgi:hypothetical protein
MAATTAKKAPVSQNTRQQLDELDALLQKMLALPVNPLDAGNDEPEPEPIPVREPRRTESTVLPRRVSLRPVQQQQQQQPAQKTVPTPTTTPTPEQPVSVLGPRLVQPEAALPVRDLSPQEEEPASEDWVPLRGDWQPSAQTWGPLAEIFKQQFHQEQQPAPQATDEPGVIRETVVLPVPARNAAEQPHLPTPTPPLDTDIEPTPNSVEAMARLNAARRPAPTTPAPQPTSAPEPPTPAPGLGLWPVIALNKVFDALTYPLGPLGGWLRGSTGRALLAFLGGVFIVAAGILLTLDWCEWT